MSRSVHYHRGEAPTITRAGYHRKAYTRKDGTHVKAAYVAPAEVPAKGMALVTGHKGHKLIDMKDYRHLRDFGYNFEKDAPTRRRALDKAAEQNSYLWVIHRVNAIRTLTKNDEPGISHKADIDLKHIEEKYKHYKTHHAREPRSAVARAPRHK